MEWEAAEVVAAVTATGTILAVGLAAWSIKANKDDASARRTHDEQMQDKRLIHKHRLTHEVKAAEAYEMGLITVDLMKWDYIESRTRGNDRDGTREVARMLREAIAEFRKAQFYAWDDEMIAASAQVIDTAVELEKRADASAGMIRARMRGQKVALAETERTYNEKWQAYSDAVKVYWKSSGNASDS